MSCDCCGEVVRQLRAAERRVAELEALVARLRTDLAGEKAFAANLRASEAAIGRRNIALRGVVTRMKKARKG